MPPAVKLRPKKRITPLGRWRLITATTLGLAFACVALSRLGLLGSFESPPTDATTAEANPVKSAMSPDHSHSAHEGAAGAMDCGTGTRQPDGYYECDHSHGTANHSDVSKYPFDQQPTTEQVAAANAFRSSVITATRRYSDISEARAQGYRIDEVKLIEDALRDQPGLLKSWQSGLHSHGFVAHIGNPDLYLDGVDLDPGRPEWLMYWTDGSQWKLVGVMFLVPLGHRGPQPFGPTFFWHYHHWDRSCMNDAGFPLSYATERSQIMFEQTRDPSIGCTAGRRLPKTPEMLHVWTVDNPEGAWGQDMSPTLITGR